MIDKSITRDQNILDSIKDCLADIIDIGFMVQSSYYLDGYYPNNNVYSVRITTPRALSYNRNNRSYEHDAWDAEVDYDPWLSDGETTMKMKYEGMKTYEKIKKELNFLCSYIPDMFGISLKYIRIEFIDSKYNTLTIPSQEHHCGLIDEKSFLGLMNSDIVVIDIRFERELPGDVEKWMDDFIKDEHLPKKQSWFRKLIDKFM